MSPVGALSDEQVIPDRCLEHTVKCFGAVGDGQRPHGLGKHRLGGHLVCLGQTVFFLDAVPDAVGLHGAPLVGDLRRHHNAHPLCLQASDALLKGAVVIVRDSADPEALENDGMAVRRRIVEDSGIDTGRQFDKQDIGIEPVIKPLLPRDVSLDIVLHPSVSHQSHGRKSTLEKAL